MGNKDSKSSIIPYEEAVKRVTEDEFKRLQDVFRRYSTPAGYMSKAIFVRDVFGDGIPQKLGEHLFYAFGGSSKGLVFRDLFCGLVLLTKGSQTEKLRFIFSIIAHQDDGFYVARVDLESFIAACDGIPPPAEMTQLFRHDHKVSYEQFCSWLLRNCHVMKISAWLLEEGAQKGLRLSDESDTPTFYQTLAGVTHLEELDIIDLEKRYWSLQSLSKSGRLDLETLRPLISPPLPCDLVEGVFNAFDENQDGHVDLKEMACGLSACCRGPKAERLKFCFKIFDFDRDSLLSQAELENMCKSLLNVRRENRVGQEIDFKAVENLNPLEIAADILANHDEDKDGLITAEEFQVWAVKNSLPDDFNKLLFQICHIVLGLKPLNRQEEKEIILGWVERESRRGLRAGQTWYLLASSWWQTWLDYVSQVDNSNSDSGKQTKLTATQSNHIGPIPVPSNAWADMPSTSTSSRSYSTLPANFRKKDGSIHPLQSTSSNEGSPKKRNGGSKSPKEEVTGSVKPGPVNNTVLVTPDAKKVTSLTNEGGRLRKSPSVVKGRDYEVVPEPVWKALALWYAGGPALPRNVIVPNHQDPVPLIELYPLHVKLLRHQTQQQKQNGWNNVNISIGGLSLGANQLGFLSSSNNTTPKKYLAHTACFSKLHTVQQVHEFLAARLRIRVEEMRMWNYKDDNNPIIMEDDSATMEQLGIVEDQNILIEVRNKDLSWPEEMSLLAKNKQEKYKQVISEGGVTGLSNLGNTCFMNAAIQCLSNTQPLTLYFKTDSFIFELNTTNPLGMKGHIARRYGDLIRELWSGTAKSIAPLKLRWTIAKYAPRFSGFQQHDSQELLAFLLDGLHEDLNRVQQKKYVELKDSDGRPDEEVAQEAWENHLVRNQSVVVDLFQGLLKSQVRCKTCGHVSVRFDPFTFLSLPLPMESSMHVEIFVVRLDGSVPVRFGLRLNMDDKYRVLKRSLAELCDLSPDQLLLVEIGGAIVRSFPQENQKVRNLLGGNLYAYEIPPPAEETPIPELTLAEERQLESPHLSQNPNMPPVNVVVQDSSLDPPNNSSSTNGSSSPEKDTSPSAKSSTASTPVETQNLKPFGSMTKTHSRNPSNASIASSVTSSPSQTTLHNIDGLVIAMHRKQIRMDMYFLAWQKTRPCLFSTPLILPACSSTLKEDLYKMVWTHVSRFVVATGPADIGSGHIHNKNHAEDGDSPRQMFPYTLKAVQKDGLNCAFCPWYRFCRGCEIDCLSEELGPGVAFIAIEWDPTALHLRYQSSQERAFTEHESVEKSRRMQTEPIDLDDCLRAFTKEEELGEDEMYYCSKCKEHRLAAKKLDIWRLPPILIIHLKRFQFVNGRWIKSQKLVKCPKSSFNLTNFLATREKTGENKNDVSGQSNDRKTEDELGLNSITVEANEKSNQDDSEVPKYSEVDSSNKYIIQDKEGSNTEGEHIQMNGHNELPNGKIEANDGWSSSTNSDSEGTSKPKLQKSLSQLSTPVDATDSHPLISKLQESAEAVVEDDNTNEYNLYSVVCHTGILGGGHYVSYAVNPNDRWYCFNDSSVKEVKGDIDLDNAYMLFYERESLRYASYIPNTKGSAPDLPPIEDEIEDNYRKLCVIQ